MKAIHQNTTYTVTGVYGSLIEPELQPNAAYVFLKEMKRFLVLKREFVKSFAQWRFEFAELIGGKTVVFVYHQKILKGYCRGPNAFFVEKK